MPYEYRDRNKRRTGKWVCDAVFSHLDGTRPRHHKVYDTHAEADRVEKHFRATGEILLPDQKLAGKTFAEVADMFVAATPDWGKHRSARQRLQMAKERLGHLDVMLVRFDQLEAYTGFLRARKQANRTIIAYLTVVFRVLRYALKKELIEGLPAKPEIKNKGRKVPAVTMAQERAIVHWMDRNGYLREAFCIVMLASTGMRCGEFLGLSPHKQIENTGFWLEENETKTEQRRWVPLIPALAQELRLVLRSSGLPDREHLYHILQLAKKAVGECQGVKLHGFRHTTVTRLFDAGVQEIRIKQYVGHSTGSVTMRYDDPDRQALALIAQKVQHTVGEMLENGQVVPLKSQDYSAAI
jgi:integrase